MDQFEAFFRRADLDGDGRISGAEVVSFFQGSNLPKHVLAQVSFFLFYNNPNLNQTNQATILKLMIIPLHVFSLLSNFSVA